MLTQAQQRMTKDRISQRELAARLRLSQGHLSRVLRKKVPLAGATLSRLQAWASEGPDTAEADVMAAARAVAGGSRRKMRTVMQLMHLLVELQRGGTRPNRSGAVSRR
jgi:transcriptional regulator with XRE-family HTH domain